MYKECNVVFVVTVKRHETTLSGSSVGMIGDFLQLACHHHTARSFRQFKPLANINCVTVELAQNAKMR